MKKLTLLTGVAMVAGLLASLPQVSAQITLTQSDLPSVGFKVVIDSDGVTNPNPGVSNISSPQFWDFSNLKRQKSKVDTFLAPSTTQYGSVFPTANLCDSTYGGNGYNFFNIGSSQFTVVGAEEIVVAAGNNFQIEINLNPTFMQSALPATTTSNNIAAGVATGSQLFSKTFSLVVTGEKFSTTIQYRDTVDAYGTMKMPNGQTYDVLRQKHYETDYDSVSLDELSVWTFYERIITNKNQYDWYAKGVGYILAEEDMSVTFDTIKNVWWDTTAPAPSGINPISLKHNISVYPNPSDKQINFMMTGIKSDENVFVYDVAGREMDRVVMKNGNAALNTSIYANGLYLYNVTDASGNLVDHGKFMVQH